MTLFEKLMAVAGISVKHVELEARDGYKAESLLKDEIFSKVVEDMRAKIINEWASSPLRDVEGQYNLRLMIKILDDMVSNIVTDYETGRLAKKQIIEDAEKKKRKK